MKSKYTILALLLVLSLVFPLRLVLAHETEEEGSISAVMHVEPDHKPVAGERAVLSFDFSDEEGKLDLTNCTCSIRIQKATTTVFMKNILENSVVGLTSHFFEMEYIFPENGEYSVVVEGSPKSSSSFSSFRLAYTVLVGGKGEDHENHGGKEGHLLHIIFLGGAILIIGIILIRGEKKS